MKTTQGSSYVDIEYDQAILGAFKHLVELGHKNIGFLTFPAAWRLEGNTGPTQCMQGFEQARRTFDINTAVREVAMSVDDVYQATFELFDELPQMTAIVSAYSATQAGTYRALFEPWIENTRRFFYRRYNG